MKEVLYMIAPRGVPDCTSTASHSDDGTAEQPLGGPRLSLYQLSTASGSSKCHCTKVPMQLNNQHGQKI